MNDCSDKQTEEDVATQYFTTGCVDARDDIEGLKIRVMGIRRMFHATHKFPEMADAPEMIANVVLAYRHLEDARMRFGKAIQACNGGVSIYDSTEQGADVKKSLQQQSNNALEMMRFVTKKGRDRLMKAGYVEVVVRAILAIILDKDVEQIDEWLDSEGGVSCYDKKPKMVSAAGTIYAPEFFETIEDGTYWMLVWKTRRWELLELKDGRGSLIGSGMPISMEEMKIEIGMIVGPIPVPSGTIM